MKHDNPFAKLGVLDQKLYQDTEGVRDNTPQAKSQNASNPVIQNTGNPENKFSRNPETISQAQIPEIQHSRNPAIQNFSKRELFTKATYRLCDEALDAVGDAKRILKRQYKVKVNLEEIVETAILDAYKDLIRNKGKSSLVSKYSGNPENQNT